MARRDAQLNLPPLLVQSMDDRAAIACPAEVKPVDVGRLLRESVEASGCQHKEAALSAECQPDYWNRALNSERGLTLNRLGKLPARVQREFIKRWAFELRLRVTDEDVRARVIANLARAAVEALTEIEP
jgi:hypothetical protein